MFASLKFPISSAQELSSCNSWTNFLNCFYKSNNLSWSIFKLFLVTEPLLDLFQITLLVDLG